MTRKRDEFEKMLAKQEVRASIKEDGGYLSASSSEDPGNSFIAEMGFDTYGDALQTER